MGDPVVRNVRKWPLWLVGLSLALTGCETAHFYSQAVHGQWQIMREQRPNAQVIADEGTPAGLRRQLEKVERLRAFAAAHLRLPGDEQYAAYRDLGRSHVAWAVFAAPEFSLEAKTWWYPLVGRLKYRGWFSEREARRRGAALEARGHDVFIAEVPAYSTLGWLRDPVLNTFVYLQDVELAELIFHELCHKRVFIPGDTDFNEAFATAAAREGVRRWLLHEGRRREAALYELHLRREREFLSVIERTVEELERLYGRAEVPEEEMRREKEEAFRRLRQRYEELKAGWGGYAGYDPWFEKPINNARLVSLATYYDLVPAFEALLAAHRGDLDAFYEAVRETGRLSKEQRREFLSALEEAAESQPARD